MNIQQGVASWLTQILSEKRNIEITHEVVATESVVLYKDELDIVPYPSSMEEKLPAPLLLDVATYETEKDSWMAVFTKNEDGKELFCARLFQNGEPFVTWFPIK